MSVLCLGEVWLELNAATAPELTETFRAQTGGWGADFCRQYAALGGQAALLAQLGADPFGRKLAARLAGLAAIYPGLSALWVAAFRGQVSSAACGRTEPLRP